MAGGILVLVEFGCTKMSVPEIDDGEAVYHETVNRLLNVRVQGPPGSITSNFSVLSDFTLTSASLNGGFDYFGYSVGGVTGIH